MWGPSLEAKSDAVHLPEQVMVKKCLDIVRDFRTSKVTKFDAVFTISCNIRENLPKDSDEPTSSSHVEEVTFTEVIRGLQATSELGELLCKQAKFNFSSVDLKPENWMQDQKQAKLMLMYHKWSPEFYEPGWADIVMG
ncbi:hypothetical protein BDR06DRAFT_973638 [Suillus hirtellus]|nr:hypothetical protein BDR06DRAFT_973638 [Suillus hirtellus]